MLPDQLDWHMKKHHTYLDSAAAKKVIDSALDPRGNLIRASGASNRRGRSKSAAIGLRVIADLSRGNAWEAEPEYTFRCSSCSALVIALNVENKKEKLFDVDSGYRIVSTHVCQEKTKGSSIFAFSGGVVDSNRRRH
jgi:hypothetical protein